MVIEPVELSSFRKNTTLSTTFRNLRERLNIDPEFNKDIALAFAEEKSLTDQDFFNPTLETDSTILESFTEERIGEFSTLLPMNISEGPVNIVPQSGS